MYDALQMKTQRPAIMKCKKLYKIKCSDPSTMNNPHPPPGYRFAKCNFIYTDENQRRKIYQQNHATGCNKMHKLFCVAVNSVKSAILNTLNQHPCSTYKITLNLQIICILN